MQVPSAGPVLVVGPGALGLLFAARLHAAGTPVVLAARTAAAASGLAARGIVAHQHDGSRVEAKVPVVNAPRQLAQPARMLVLATKCAAAAEALATWLPALAEDAPVVALQNGVMGDELKALAGDRLVECTVALPATLEAPGVSRQTGPGKLLLGPWPKAGPRDEPKAFRQVAEVLADCAPVQASGNMRGVKWTKLLINSCITTLGATSGQELGVLLRHKAAQEAFLAIVEEGYRAGKADGVRFEPVVGFRPWMFAKPLPGRRLLLAALARRYRRHRSSSLQSLQRGQRTEVDYLNGHIAATARRHGLAAPVNTALLRTLHRIERDEAKPSLSHVSEACGYPAG